MIKVFYSWQSDSPNGDNHYFIEQALKAAIKVINKDESIVDELFLDRDTKGVAGAPIIAETILSKIDEATVFVADVTIIGRADSGKSVTNPNVMLELGYAFKALKNDNLILVINKAYGEIDDLPFDLKHRRVMSYNLLNNADETIRKKVRQELQRDFEAALKGCLSSWLPRPTARPAEQLQDYLLDNDSSRAKHLIEIEADKLADQLKNIIGSNTDNESMSAEKVFEQMQKLEDASAEYLNAFVLGCYKGDLTLADSLVTGLKQIANINAAGRGRTNIHLYPALLLLYAGGLATVARGNYRTLAAFMNQVAIEIIDGGIVPAAFQLTPYRVIDERVAKNLPPVINTRTPISKYFFGKLREPLKKAIRLEQEYANYFLRFEYLFALTNAISNEKYGLGFAVPVGSYQLGSVLRKGRPFIFEATDEELGHEKETWSPFEAGLFNCSFEDFLTIKKTADEKIKKMINQDFPNLEL